MAATKTPKKGKKKQFPTPDEVTNQNPVAWRSSEDIIEIANEMNNWQYTTLAQAVQDWALGHAIKMGWHAVYFPLAYPSRTLRAGAVFVKSTHG